MVETEQHLSWYDRYNGETASQNDNYGGNLRNLSPSLLFNGPILKSSIGTLTNEFSGCIVRTSEQSSRVDTLSVSFFLQAPKALQL